MEESKEPCSLEYNTGAARTVLVTRRYYYSGKHARSRLGYPPASHEYTRVHTKVSDGERRSESSSLSFHLFVCFPTLRNVRGEI